MSKLFKAARERLKAEYPLGGELEDLETALAVIDVLVDGLKHICTPTTPDRKCCMDAWQSHNSCDFENHLFAVGYRALEKARELSGEKEEA